MSQQTCYDCKYSGDKLKFHYGLCNSCYHKENKDPKCKICYKYCNKDDIHNDYIICEKCWNIYNKVKNCIELEPESESELEPEEYQHNSPDCKTQ